MKIKARNIYYRIRQFCFSAFMYLAPLRNSKLIVGAGSIERIPKLIKKEKLHKVLVVTTPGFIRRGSLEPFFQSLRKTGIAYAVFSKVQPDPTIECVEEAVAFYKEEKCQAIVAIGGGSVIDCSKALGARIARPKKSLTKMQGLLKVLKRIPTIYAVPTTAGTGSEATAGAVITSQSVSFITTSAFGIKKHFTKQEIREQQVSEHFFKDKNTQSHYKFTILDLCLVPRYAILDSELTCGLPASITAVTGMDALTHAVEAYTNRFCSPKAKKYALKSVKLIYENLLTAYEDGSNLKARENMLLASYYAGMAINSNFIGYIHALAHGIGGLYGVTHGMANAILMPYVLEAYEMTIDKKLTNLAKVAGIAGNGKDFIASIRELNQKMNIPEKVAELEKRDFTELAKRAVKEGNPTYPVPIIWEEQDFKKVLKRVLM